jgi:hypothetical protein
MKKLILILLFVFSVPIYAGFDMDNGFRYFESSKNLVYESVAAFTNNKKIDNRVVSNIAIIDLKSNDITYLFDSKFEENVAGLYFENSFLVNQKQIEFNIRSDGDSYYIRNNRNIQARPIKDKLCILTYSPITKKYSLWFCTKRVNSLTMETIVLSLRYS